MTTNETSIAAQVKDIQDIIKTERIAAVDEYRREILLTRSLDRFKVSRERKSVNDHIAEIMREDEQERMIRDAA